MANDLTGDFDVVAEFAILAADRVLAAMHRCERFLHAMSVRVDDNPPPGSKVKPVVVGSVDSFGDVTVNHDYIGTPTPWPGSLAATDAVYSGLDLLVNTDLGGAFDPPVVPSHLQGRAQLQLAPPTVGVPDASGANITVKMDVRARYFPDPHTSPVAEFVRGELQITAPVAQVASQKPNVSVIDVDLKADSLSINFVPFYPTNLSAEDLAGISLLIRNALWTSFLPSTEQLPDRLKYLKFKTLLGTPSALGVLLNLANPDPAVVVAEGHPATVNNVFLGAGDDFGFAVGSDVIVQRFKSQLAIQPPSGSFLSYTISLQDPNLELQTGRIVLSISGHAHSSVLPDFDFTISQAFTLNLAATTPGGPIDTAVLAVLGDISVDVHLPWPFGWVADEFISWTLGPVRKQRDDNVWVHQPDVVQMFSADKNLGEFLKRLLNPAQPQPGVPPPQDVTFVLAYTSVDISPSGIILHGSLDVTPWPAAHAEYEPIPATRGVGVVGTGGAVFQGPDYSALKSWIPGGTIQRFEWGYQGQTQPFIDENRFVLLASGPQVAGAMAFTGVASSGAASGTVSGDVSGAVGGYTPLCLTVRGTRLSSSGPVVAQPVTASVCGYNSFPVVNGLSVALNGTMAMVALTQPGPEGRVQLVGHTPAQVDRTGRGTPNVIVHFADEKTSANLAFLTQALRESGRKDATTAVLAVLTPDQLTKARYTQGVIYGDSQGGAWERVFGVKTARRPVTLIAGPNGKVVWQQDGEVDSKTLAAALKKGLAAGGSVRHGLLSLNLRIGRQAPNFLFELAPGRGLTLRKLAGRSVILVFWRSTSKPSMEAVRDLQETVGKAGGRGPVVLAINDGEAIDLAKKAATENGLTATLVTDPERMISLAYGLSIWPTMVFLDASGLVTGIRYGRFAGDPVASPTGQEPAASR